MGYEAKNLSGALFKNDKEGNDKRPDYKGDCMINGVEYQIGAWLKVSAKGTKFMSLKFEAKQRQDVSSQASGGKSESYSGGIRNQPPADDFDDAPF